LFVYFIPLQTTALNGHPVHQIVYAISRMMPYFLCIFRAIITFKILKESDPGRTGVFLAMRLIILEKYCMVITKCKFISYTLENMEAISEAELKTENC